MFRASKQISRIVLLIRDSHGKACRDAVRGILLQAHGLDKPVADESRARR